MQKLAIRIEEHSHRPQSDIESWNDDEHPLFCADKPCPCHAWNNPEPGQEISDQRAFDIYWAAPVINEPDAPGFHGKSLPTLAPEPYKIGANGKEQPCSQNELKLCGCVFWKQY